MTPSAKQSQEKKADAIKGLHGLGAHFVLCRGGDGPKRKAAICPRWQLIKPPVANVLAHLSDGRLIGLIPFSLKTTGLDVDRGDPARWCADYPPLAELLSEQAGRSHLYYFDDEGRRNAKWESHGCSGEIRGARGYFCLWDDEAKLYQAVTSPPPGAVKFPADLFDAVGDPIKIADVHDPTFSKNPKNRPNPNRPLPADLELERIYPGGRNDALFDAVRFRAYAENMGRSLYRWERRVIAYAENQNKRFPVPFGAHPGDGKREVERIGLSVAGWTWSGGGPVDHSPPAQRRRGIKSGRGRRLNTKDRDAAMVAYYVAGNSLRACAEQFGMSYFAVRHVIARDAGLLLRNPGNPNFQ